MIAQFVRTARGARALFLGAAILFAGHGLPSIAAQPSEFSAVIQIVQGSTDPMEMTYWFGDGQVRMDTPEASMIWAGGENARMLMIQHGERRYIEWGSEQLKMMQQMMGGLSGMNLPDAANESIADLSFEATGERESIGAWDAFEVQVQSGQGAQGHVWLSEGLEIGLFEVLARVAQIAGTLQMPLGADRNNNPQQMLLRYSEYAQAQGRPDGRAVRIVSSDSDQDVTMTLTGVQSGPLPSGTFDPPADYQKMEMPAIPGIR